MKTVLSLVFAILFVPSFAFAQDDSVSSIRNFLRVNKDFCTGGQPRLEHLAQR